MKDQIYSESFIFNQKIKNIIQIEGFQLSESSPLKITEQNNYVFSSGAYSYPNPEGYKLNLIEPFYQKNQTVQSLINITPAELPTMREDEKYEIQFKAIGGEEPYIFSPNIEIDSFNQSFTITASDATATVSRTFFLSVRENPEDLRIYTEELKSGDQNEEYEFQLFATGGTGLYKWTFVLAPSWLQINESSGLIFGTIPTNARGFTYIIVVRLEDGTRTIEKTFELEIKNRANTRLSFLTPEILPSAVLNRTYSHLIQFNSSTNAITLSVSNLSNWLSFDLNSRILSGLPEQSLENELNLPPNSNLTSTGLFYGITPSTGLYNFSIKVEDSRGIYQTQFYSWLISKSLTDPLRFDTTSLPSAVLNSDYSFQLAALGGNPPYKFSLVLGSILPPGLELSESGLLSGIPELFSVPQFIHQPYYSFRILVSDRSGNQKEHNFVLYIEPKQEVIINSLPGVVEKTYISQIKLKIIVPKKIKNQIIFINIKLLISILFNENLSGTLTFGINHQNQLIINNDLLKEFDSSTLKQIMNFTSLTDLDSKLSIKLAPILKLFKYQII